MAGGSRTRVRSHQLPNLSVTLKRHYEFEVGKAEKHKVVLENERPLLLAGFRAHTYRVFVDGQLAHEQSGY